MEIRIDKALGKIHDLKICKECGIVNWYENEICWNCNSKDFGFDDMKIIRYIDTICEEYKAEGYSEEEIMDFIIEV